ncbi:probable RNA-binding protein EIF1AD [Euwallacea fornicatus]|uniref:probable RNA-binding protein EIF1AD n=1 Tax=Euwallacea fornicatus TaxID=995702 RepID=UPI00338F55A3
MSYSKKYRVPTMPVTARQKYIDQNQEHDIPADHQEIVLIICNKGNYLFEAKASDGRTLSVYLPPRFRKLLWIRRGSFVLVEAIDDKKLKAEVVKVYTLKHIQLLKNDNAWPKEFETAGYKNSPEPDNVYKFVNTNRPADARDSDGSDQSGTESGSEQEYSMDEDYESDSYETDTEEGTTST